MTKQYSERNVIAKLIKVYVLYNPYCTARDISQFLESEKFGIVSNVTAGDVSNIIRDFNNKGYGWFDLLRIEKKGLPSRYMVRE